MTYNENKKKLKKNNYKVLRNNNKENEYKFKRKKYR